LFESRGGLAETPPVEEMNRITKLTRKCVQTGGRNNHGVTTVFHRGGGNKKLYRIIDYKRSLPNHPAIVKKTEYDPNRTSYIALVSYRNGMISYILAPKNLSVGDQICAGPTAEIKVGSASPVSNIPIGTAVHNVESKPGRGGQLMRAAGTYAKIIKKDQNHVIIRLHTGKSYSIPSQSMATIGEVSNDAHKNRKLTKAGQSRWKNRRPVVRGVAMNPIDHPHGGGEGRSKGGRHPVSP
jgi:large subunit ribosomal protein L2